MPSKATGFRFQCCVEQTKDKGQGVFAREPIKKGTVVWRHIPGVLAVYDEQSFGAMIEKMRSADVVYELTHVHAFEEFPGCLIRALDDGALINHSRDPNLGTKKTEVTSPAVDARSVADKSGAHRYASRYSR